MRNEGGVTRPWAVKMSCFPPPRLGLLNLRGEAGLLPKKLAKVELLAFPVPVPVLDWPAFAAAKAAAPLKLAVDPRGRAFALPNRIRFEGGLPVEMGYCCCRVCEGPLAEGGTLPGPAPESVDHAYGLGWTDVAPPPTVEGGNRGEGARRDIGVAIPAASDCVVRGDSDSSLAFRLPVIPGVAVGGGCMKGPPAASPETFVRFAAFPPTLPPRVDPAAFPTVALAFAYAAATLAAIAACLSLSRFATTDR